MLEQHAGMPRILRRNEIDAPQDLQRAQSNVAAISDRRRHDVKHASAIVARDVRRAKSFTSA